MGEVERLREEASARMVAELARVLVEACSWCGDDFRGFTADASQIMPNLRSAVLKHDQARGASGD